MSRVKKSIKIEYTGIFECPECHSGFLGMLLSDTSHYMCAKCRKEYAPVFKDIEGNKYTLVDTVLEKVVFRPS